MRTTLLTIVLALLAGALTGCQTASPSDRGMAPIDTLADDGFDATRLPVHRGDASGPVDFDVLVDELARADIVLVGEVHNHERGLDFIATLFETLAQREPDLALSMEFYERDHQVHVDDYLKGITGRDAFAKATDRTESNNPIGHQRMVETARALDRRIIASNAPRRYTTLARTDGYDALESLAGEQRRLFAVPPRLPTGAYAERFNEAMGAMARHGGAEMIESFLRAQALWDETMAASVSRAAARGADVYHVAGHFHADFAPAQGGSFMADRIRDRLGKRVRMRSVVVHQGGHASLMPEDLGAADFVVYADAPVID